MTAAALLAASFFVFWLYRLLTVRYALENVRYRCGFSLREATEGDELWLEETVENRKTLPLQWLKVHIPTSRYLEFARTRSVVAQDKRYVDSSFTLHGFEKITRRWKVRCLKRGVFTIKQVSLVGGALALPALKSTPITTDAEIIVYPASLEPDKWLKPVSPVSGAQPMQRFILEDPFLVAGAKEYQSSDPLNRIHWNATAEAGKLMTRKNEYTTDTNVLVVLNIRSREAESIEVLDPETAEKGIRVAAGLFRRALAEGVMIGLATNGRTENGNDIFVSPVLSGFNHVRELLTDLARIRLEAKVGLTELLLALSRESAGLELVVITSYAGSALQDAVWDIRKSTARIRFVFTKACVIPVELYQLASVYVLDEDIKL
ncbi:MAG: DUF58 domain-containing protein [Clostridiaceae bacterium]|nr:DUF58 domain-containing protein [Clostridiaceae bacterium]